MTTALVCEDHVQLRESLARALRHAVDVQRVELVGRDHLLRRFSLDHRDCLVFVGSHRGRLAADVIWKLLTAEPDVNVIAVGKSHEYDAIAAAVAAGARGFLRWDAITTRVLATLAHAVGSDQPVPPEVSERLIRDEFELTEREMQVLLGMSEGLSNGEIGRRLLLTEDTVKSHARRLFGKLGARDRAHAVAHGFRHSLLS